MLFVTIADMESLKNNVLFVKVADDYNSLPKKVIAAYSAVIQIFNFKYLFVRTINDCADNVVS